MVSSSSLEQVKIHCNKVVYMKMGRPNLPHKSISRYVRIPYEINLRLEQYCNRNKEKSISSILLQALVRFLDDNQEL